MANKQFLDKDGVDRLAQGLKALMPTKVSQLENDSGYKTVDTNTTYAFASGDNNGQIKITPSGGTAQNVDVKGLGSLAFSSESIPKKVSDIENDKKYITNINEETNDYTFESNGNSLNKNIIYGNSQQAIRSGRNLYNFEDTTEVNNSYSVDKDGWITITYDNTNGNKNMLFNYYTNNLNLKTNTNYAIVLEIKSVSGSGHIQTCSLYDNSGQFTSNIDYALSNLENNTTKIDIRKTKDSFDGLEEKGLRSFVYFTIGQSGSITFRLSVLENTIINANDFEYEPYGVSPSPDYPSEIKSVEGVRNLFDKDNAKIVNVYMDNASGKLVSDGNYPSCFYIQCKENTTYTISRELKSRYFYVAYTTELPQANVNFYGRVDNYTGSSLTITTGENAKYLVVRYYYVDDGYTKEELLDKMQVEQGTTPHTYVPYGSWLVEKITGNNILNPNEIVSGGYSILNGNYFSSEASFCTNKKIKIDNKKPYYLSHNTINEGQYYYVLYYDENNNYIGNYSLPMTTKTMNLSNFTKYSQAKYINIRFDTPISQMNNIQLNNKLTEYELYKEQKVLIDMNKPNLFDKDNANLINLYPSSSSKGFILNNNYKSIYIKIEPNTTYTVYRNIYMLPDIAIGTSVDIPVENGIVTNQKSININVPVTITSGENDKYLTVYYNWTENEEVRNSIKIYKGYDPYYELSSVGDIKDNLDVVSGILTKRIGKVVLDGSESWTKRNDGDGSTTISFNYNINNIGRITQMNNRFQNSTSSTNGIEGLAIPSQLNQIYVQINRSRLSSIDVEEFKMWLSNNPITVYYVLAEPEIIQLKLNYLQTYKGVNNIIIDSNIQPSKIEIGYDNAENIGNEVYVGTEEPHSEEAMIWIEPDDFVGMGTEVVNSLEGNETTMAPSVKAVNNKFDGIVLYDNANGSTGNIPLSDNPKNYKTIKIHFVDQDDQSMRYQTFEYDTDKDKITIGVSGVSNTSPSMCCQKYNIQNGQLEKYSSYAWDPTHGVFEYSTIRITKVVGYK